MGKTTSTLPQYQYKKKHGFFYNLKKYRVLTLMCVPAIVFFFAFNYMPLPGIYVAFVKYNYRDGIFGSKFVGMKNFEFLMQSGKLLDLTKNTILYNLAFIFLGNIIAMLMAVLLNEIHNKYFKKVSQTLMFLPYFISQVLVGFLVFNLLNYDTGFINGILVKLGMEKWQPYSDKSVDFGIAKLHFLIGVRAKGINGKWSLDNSFEEYGGKRIKFTPDKAEGEDD